MNNHLFEEWNREMRKRATQYLETHGIEDPQIGDHPAFDVAPHFGAWCVESKRIRGDIGWWVFAGDCPTDYVSEEGERNPRSALERLIAAWATYIPYMKEGRQPPGMHFGENSKLRELGELLEKRVSLLQEWLADDEMWI